MRKKVAIAVSRTTLLIRVPNNQREATVKNLRTSVTYYRPMQSLSRTRHAGAVLPVLLGAVTYLLLSIATASAQDTVSTVNTSATADLSVGTNYTPSGVPGST